MAAWAAALSAAAAARLGEGDAATEKRRRNWGLSILKSWGERFRVVAVVSSRPSPSLLPFAWGEAAAPPLSLFAPPPGACGAAKARLQDRRLPSRRPFLAFRHSNARARRSMRIVRLNVKFLSPGDLDAGACVPGALYMCCLCSAVVEDPLAQRNNLDRPRRRMHIPQSLLSALSDHAAVLARPRKLVSRLSPCSQRSRGVGTRSWSQESCFRPDTARNPRSSRGPQVPAAARGKTDSFMGEF